MALLRCFGFFFLFFSITTMLYTVHYIQLQILLIIIPLRSFHSETLFCIVYYYIILEKLGF